MYFAIVIESTYVLSSDNLLTVLPTFFMMKITEFYSLVQNVPYKGAFLTKFE